MKVKKSGIVLIGATILLLLISLVSASFLGLLKDLQFKITGMAESQTAMANLTIGNQVPHIFNITNPQSFGPIEGDVSWINISFLADDPDGISNFDNSSANFSLILLSGSNFDGISTNSTDTRFTGGGCVAEFEGSNTTVQNYSCGVAMIYYMAAATNGWGINVTIADANGAVDDYNETADMFITYTSLTAINMTPANITWPAVSFSQANVSANNDPLLVGNSGNYNISNDLINITGFDLEGETTLLQWIPAGNFTANATDTCVGTWLANGSSVDILDTTLPNGMEAGERAVDEELYFCLQDVPASDAISQQSYSTGATYNWIVGIS